MKKLKLESSNVTTTVEQAKEDQLKQLPIKRLRLTADLTQNEQQQFEANLSAFTDLRLEISSRISLPSVINEIFELINQFFSNLQQNRSSESLDQFISFILLKLDFLFAKLRSNELNEYKLESIAKLLLQLLVKYFEPVKLRPYFHKFLEYLQQTKNNKLICELLNLWTIAPDTTFNIEEIKEELLPYLKRNLRNDDHRIRSKCLKILAYHYSDHETFANNKLIKIILNFTEDQDPRVRATSLESIIRLHLSGKHLLTTDYYDDLKQHLNDDFDPVRLLAIEAITLLALTYPDFLVTVANNQEEDHLRLIDDAFAKLCLMINDISVEVKVCASYSLGRLNGVSPKFLIQTLDKNIMSDLKSKKSKQRAKQLASSEWSSDSTITEEDNLNLMSSSACGAFVHGLEDECLEVRGESVDALCQLAINCPELAAKAIDFFVDMFNDEIESVRLKAIIALIKIAHYVLLGDDQIDIVLSVIEDGSLEVREALRDLLSNCKLATKIGLKKATQALFTNLRRYSFDKYSIWKCFKSLGLNHSKFVMSLVSYLIGLHPFLDVTEPDMNDPFYMSSLILIYNGLSKNSAILPLLPKFVINHYFFLKLKLPDLVPNINLIDSFPITITNLIDNEVLDKNKRIEKFFLNTINNLKISKHSNNSLESTVSLLESIGKDMVYLSEINPGTSVACEIMKTFVDCYLIIKKNESSKFQSTIDCNKLIQIEEALVLAIRLLVLYKGYNTQQKLILHQLYLFLRGFYLKELYNIKMSLNANSLSHNSIMNSYLKKNFFKQDLIKECRLYLSFMKLFNSISQNCSNEFILKIIDNMQVYESNPLNLIELLNTSLFNDFNLDQLILSEKTENFIKVSLDLIEPVENLETPIRYTPGLICSLKLKAILNHFTRFDNLCIQIRYSDNDKQYVPIELNSIKKISDEKHLLETNINLSNLAWTDVCYIKICLSMLIDEVSDFEDSMLELLDKDDTYQKSNQNNSNRNLNQKNFKSQCDSIELSNTVKIYFEPSLAKKFI